MRTIAEIVTRGKDGGGGVGSRVGRAQVVSRIRRTRQEEYGMYVFCTRISALLNIPISLPSLFLSLRIESE